MEDFKTEKQNIEGIANGEILKEMMCDKLKGYSISYIKGFCMKLYGRIPMGDIAISEAYDKDGHYRAWHEVISSGLTMQQEREKENLIATIAHIESHFGFDTWGNEEEIGSAKNESSQEQYSSELQELFKNNTKLLSDFVRECRKTGCNGRSVYKKYRLLGDKVVQLQKEWGSMKKLYHELKSIGILVVTYNTFKGYGRGNIK